MLTKMRPDDDPLSRGLHTFAKNYLIDKSVIEIGSFAGESSAIFLKYVKELYCIDIWRNYLEIVPKGTLILKASEAEVEFDKRMKQYKGKVSKMKMHSAVASLAFMFRSIDAVYLDARHDYESVIYDIILWMPKIKVGGIISGHDYGNRTHPGVKQAVDEILGEPMEVFEDMTWMHKI